MRTKLKTILCLMLAMVCVASFSITAFASEGGEVTTAPDVETTTDTTTETETPVTDEPVEDIEIPFNYTIDNDGNLIITIDGVADPAEITTIGTVVTNGGRLNLRTGAGLDFEIIDQLRPGEEVTVIGSEGDWYEVIVPEKKGYVHGDYLELIEKAAEVPGIERIRLGSLDPDMLHDDDIRRMAAVKKLCPQFHLSLQSGCDKTLRAMRRPYTTAQYADIAAKLRAAFGADNVSFTTDVIVGFPGETEDDFEASMAFVTGMRFLKVHVFPYSRREGTAAYDFADQLPEHEKEARSRRMTAAVEEVRAAEAAAMQGRKASVLLETPLSATMFTGYTKQYLPVLVSAPGHKTGDVVEVTLGAWDGKRCRAEIV